ncbi:citrate transporter [Kocuria dechangensis]|uniref:Citrate transporter n=1 Tax=Kocuria dechangensis TaxID=1176249 RepID=A0A917H551_9MICC|nr:GntP family permease [Kocuria dechangensis]GGG67708.1 citrate transporter [Kocuria dechangensis]
MIGLIGVVLALALLIIFAYRGVNVLILAPLMALLAALFAGAPLIATYTQVFMPALGKYVVTYFPLFLLGAIFGKLMNDSGSASSIARWIVDRVGAQRAILATVLACAVLTYGGVTAFVVAFAILPIGIELFRAADVPKRLMPGAIALGGFTFTLTALPGTPSIQNAIPAPFFGTDAFAAPVLGIIAGAIMFTGGMAWLTRQARRAARAGEGYAMSASAASIPSERRARRRGPGAKEADRGTTAPVAERSPVALDDQEQPPAAEPARDLPPALVAFAPIFLVVFLNYALVTWVFPSMSFDYLEQEAYGSTSIDKVSGIWAIVLALAAAIVTILLLNRRRLKDAKDSLNQGALTSMLPILNTASEVGVGAVIASVPAFTIVRNAVLGLSGNPIISMAAAVNVIAGITGSASGGLSIALQTFGDQFRQMAEDQGVSLELMHRVASIASGGFDSLPHNGAVITLLVICGMTHRQSYKDVGMVSVAIPVAALIVVVLLGSLFGAF